MRVASRARHSFPPRPSSDLIRDGKKKDVSTRVGEPTQAVPAVGKLHKLLEGASLENNPEGRGVLVANIAPNSRASQSGVRPGGVIIGAKRQQVNDVEDFSNALKRNPDSVLLHIQRGVGSFYLVIQ